MFVSEVDLLSKEWHTNKNSELGLDPTKLVVGSNKYAFWKCSTCGYEWKAQIIKRGVRGQGCPVCGREKQGKVQIENKIKEQGSLLDNYPEIAAEWDYEKNVDRPETVLSGSNHKFFWICSKCGNRWETSVAKRTTRGQGCPVCGKMKAIEKGQERIKEKISNKGSVGSLYPKLAEEWDSTKNAQPPSDFLPNSNKSVYWLCSECGYSWKAGINSRVRGTGCPACARKKGKETLLAGLINEYGSLADNAPEIAKEWDYNKNGTLTPNQVMLNTNQSVWWVCSECGYSWKTQVYTRVNGGGCPKCRYIKQGIASSRIFEGVNDLLSQAPDLAKEWHPFKNGDLTAETITKSSNKKVWWLGKCGHEWQATVASRFSGRGCPQCLKEFKISYPEKAIYYYLNRFLDCTVEENYKPEWLRGKEIDIFIPSLSFGIEYDGSNWHKDPKSDIEKNVLCSENGVELLRIREVGSPDLSYKNTYEIKPNSEKDDELKKAIEYIFRFIASNYHLVVSYQVDLSNDRASIYELMEINRKERSLATLYPDISKEWHPNKNGMLTPDYVNAHSHRKYWWICPRGHEYEMVVKHKVEKQVHCPICSNHRVLSGYNDLEFKRPDLIPLWDFNRNGDLLPSQVMEYSNIKVWWKCEKGHSYQRMISHQSGRDSGCPVCKMQILQEGVNDLQTLFPEVAAEWDYSANGGFMPNEFTPISHKRVNWKCKECGWKWNISINSRCVLGHGCPKCAGAKRWKSRRDKQSYAFLKEQEQTQEESK